MKMSKPILITIVAAAAIIISVIVFVVSRQEKRSNRQEEVTVTIWLLTIFLLYVSVLRYKKTNREAIG